VKNLAVSYQIKYPPTKWLSNVTTISPSELKICLQKIKPNYMQMFTEALFIIAKVWKQPNLQPMNG
jgi:hypothetical protein